MNFENYKDIYFTDSRYHIGSKKSPITGMRKQSYGIALQRLIQYRGKWVKLTTLSKNTKWNTPNSAKSGITTLRNQLDLGSKHLTIESRREYLEHRLVSKN